MLLPHHRERHWGEVKAGCDSKVISDALVWLMVNGMPSLLVSVSTFHTAFLSAHTSYYLSVLLEGEDRQRGLAWRTEKAVSTGAASCTNSCSEVAWEREGWISSQLGEPKGVVPRFTFSAWKTLQDLVKGRQSSVPWVTGMMLNTDASGPDSGTAGKREVSFTYSLD